MFEVFFKKSAAKELSRLPNAIIHKFQEVTEKLQTNPLPANAKKLSGYKSLYRIRIGDYRMIYLIDNAIKVITITKIGHRREVYKH